MTSAARVASLRTADADGSRALTSPAPGRFRAALGVGDLVHPGAHVGDLEVLGQLVRIVAPDGARGLIVALADPKLARAPVEFGGMLLTISDVAALGPSAGAAHTAHDTHAAHAGGSVFRAPTSGRFYGRSSPDKPAFVTVGDTLAAGATICLLEVMKTFHRVTYGGADLPTRARVVEVLVADGADVNAGDPLLALAPA